MMKINRIIQLYFPEKNTLTLKVIEENKAFFLDVAFYSDIFLEYQKNLFSEFFSNILAIKDTYVEFEDFRKDLEKKIKQFNIQLNIFKEKLNIEEKIQIRGNLQIIWEQNYFGVLIGETSLIISRNNKLEAVIINEIEDDEKIDIFSEIVKGELESGDKLININCNIYNYLDDSELKDIIIQNSVVAILFEVLSTRVEQEEIGLISVITFFQEKTKYVIKSSDKLEQIKIFLRKNKYPIGISIAIFIIGILVFSIFSYMGNNNQPVITTTINGKQVKIPVDIDTIKRQIDAFSKLDNTNTQLAKQQYEEILKSLDKLEKANIQVLEVKELRKKLQQLYFKGFHINIVTDTDGLLTSLYKFSEKELASLSGLNQIIYTNGYLNVISKHNVALGIISSKAKPIYQSVSVSSIKTCTKNLSKNGLYCVLLNNDIVNISKYGLTSVKNLDKSWPSNIVGINTYGVNKFYVLTNSSEYLQKKSVIIRYVLNGRDLFGKATPYILSDKADESLLKGIFSGSTFAIDGTFLVWTKKGLVQFYRKNYYDTKFYARIVPGWDQAIISSGDLTGKVKVLTSDNDKYVYLYDYAKQSLIVYLSAPYKTNDAYTFSYKLKYLFKIKFDLNQPVKDVTVVYNSSSSTRTIYVLTSNGIYKTLMENFMEN